MHGVKELLLPIAIFTLSLLSSHMGLLPCIYKFDGSLLVAAPRSSIVLLLVELVATIPVSGVVVLDGLGGLLSQGHHHGSHPVVGGIVHMSRWALFGWWVSILAIITWRCCLVYAAWRRDGV
jgi:hypothetical protein